MKVPKYYVTTYNRREKANSLKFKENTQPRITFFKNKDNFLRTFSLYNPDEEYVMKLKYFKMSNSQNRKKENKELSFYNINKTLKFPNLIKKNKDNPESYNEKKLLLNQLTLRKNIFDKKKDMNYNNQTYDHRYESNFDENKKEKERKEIEQKILKLKLLITSLSEQLSTTINEIDSLKLDVDVVKNFRTYILLDNNIKNININKDNNNEKNNTDEKKNVTEGNEEELKKPELKKNEKEDNKFKLDLLILSKSKLANKIKQEKIEKIAILEEKRLSLLNKINICEKELKKFRILHSNVKKELLLHYHLLLKDGKDTRKEGLVWIIQAIWNLKSNVMLSYIPKFLDEKLIIFIFKYASNLNKVKKLEKNLKDLTLKLKIKKEELNEKMMIKKSEIENSREDNNDENNDNDNDNESDDNENNDDENNDNENNYENENSDVNQNNNDNENNYENNNENNNESDNESNIDNKNDNNSKEFNKLNNFKTINKSNKSKKFEDNNINKNIKKNNSESSISEEKFQIRKIFKNDNNIDRINLTEKNISNLSNFKDFYESNKFQETFKTSIYNNTNKEINQNYYSNYLQGDNSRNVFLNYDKLKPKNTKNTFCQMSTHFMKSIFNKKLMKKGGQFMENEEKKIKLKDYESFYNTKMEYIDQSTIEIFNECKKAEKIFVKFKNETEKMVKNELNRVSRCFYLDNYGEKFNVDQKTVISAIVGEDNAMDELFKQKKEEKKYFKILNELRNGRGLMK